MNSFFLFRFFFRKKKRGVLTNGAYGEYGARGVGAEERQGRYMPMFKCNVTAVLRHPVRNAEGGAEYVESSAPALFIETRSRETGPAEAPKLREGSEFLFPPPAEPCPGDLVSCGGSEYELASVQVCRDLNGEVVCFRCGTVR